MSSHKGDSCLRAATCLLFVIYYRMASRSLTAAEAAEGFGRTLRIDAYTASQIMTELVKGYTGPSTLFTEKVFLLPTLDVDASNPDHATVVELGRGGSRREVNVTAPHGRGASGTVTISTRDDAHRCVWKQVTVENEQGARELFMEALALSVLQQDPECRGVTCGIHGLYRSPDVVRAGAPRAATLDLRRRRSASFSASARDATARVATATTGEETAALLEGARRATRNAEIAEAALGTRPPRYTFFFKLPAYPQTLRAVLSGCCARNPWSYTSTKSILRDVAVILSNLHAKYRFVHNDLHRGNVLFQSRRPILIDFGRISMVLEGTRYKAFSPERDEGFDILTYILSLYDKLQHSGKWTTSEARLYSELLVVPGVSTRSILTGVLSRWPGTYPLWHRGYHLDGLEDDYRRILYADDATGPTDAERYAFLQVIVDKTNSRGCYESVCDSLGAACLWLPRTLGCVASRRSFGRSLGRSFGRSLGRRQGRTQTRKNRRPL